MCVNPIQIKNPNLGVKNMVTSSFKDTVSAYINVPCGVCASCLGLRQTYWLERVELESQRNVVFFCTLTYQNSMLPRTRDYMHNDGTVRSYVYPDYSDIQKMFKRLRKFDLIPPGTKYIVCSEYGGSTHRPHFHMLLFVPRKDASVIRDCKTDECSSYDFLSNPYAPLNAEKVLFRNVLHEWRRNISPSTKFPEYKPLCRYIVGRDGRRTYDFRLVESSRDQQQVGKYVTKYILKFDKWLRKLRQALYNNLPIDDYVELWNTIKTKMGVSRGFALGEEFKEYVSLAYSYAAESEWLLKFRDTVSGRLLPLSPYLRDKYLDGDRVLRILYERNMYMYQQDPFDDHVVPSIAMQKFLEGDKCFVEKTLSVQERTRSLLDAYNMSDLQFFIDDE